MRPRLKIPINSPISLVTLMSIFTMTLVSSLLLVACRKDDLNPQEFIANSQWVIYRPDSTLKLNFFNLDFLNAQKGFILGTYEDTNGYHPVLIKTEDGGKKWSTLKISINSIFKSFSVVNENIIFISSSDGVYKSIDGGKNWAYRGRVIERDNFYNIHFISEDVGYAVNGYIFKTIDGGKSWKNVFQSEGYFNYSNKLVFVNDKIGFASGGIYFSDKTRNENTVNYGRILRTIDGGEKWIKTEKEFANITELYFINSFVGFVFTFNKELFKTHDGGKTWTLINNSMSDAYPKSCFVNEFEGYYTDSGGNIYSTKDGGILWSKEKMSSNFQSGFTGIACIDKKTIYALSINDLIFKKEIH